MAEPRSTVSGDGIKTEYVLGSFFKGPPIKDVLQEMQKDLKEDFGDRYLASDLLEIEKTNIIVNFRALHGEYYGSGRLQTYLIIVYTR